MLQGLTFMPVELSLQVWLNTRAYVSVCMLSLVGIYYGVVSDGKNDCFDVYLSFLCLILYALKQLFLLYIFLFFLVLRTLYIDNHIC